MSHISESTSNSPLFSFFLPIKELIEALQQHPKSGSIETVEKALESLSLQGRSLSEHELSLAQRQLTDLTAELSLVKQLLEPEESAPFTQYHSLIELASMYRRGDLEQARWHYEQLSPATKDKLCLHLCFLGSTDHLH